MALKKSLLVCTPLEAPTMEKMLASMDKAKAEGADLVELRIDSMSFSHISEVESLIKQRTLPAIVSFRLNSSGISIKSESKSTGLQVLRLALELDVEFVEMEYEVAFDIIMDKHRFKCSNSQIIISSYVNGGKPSMEKLGHLIACMQSIGADFIKLAVDVDYITDLPPIFQMLTHCHVPLIAFAVGSRGLISQLLGPKFGGFFVYGSVGSQLIPGLPSLVSLKQVYKLEHINVDTKVFGLVSNPVGHSKSPILHNLALRHAGYNGIYVPMLVDDVANVGIPHKEAAIGCCDEVHPLAKSIGAVNTIVRRPTDGKLVGYNTDCEACITAIEDALRVIPQFTMIHLSTVHEVRSFVVKKQASNGGITRNSPIAGKLFVLVGAGGAGRAIAFGAKDRGARVIIFNRNYERAKALAAAVCGEALPYKYLERFCPENGMILANASAVGMEPRLNETPVSKEALRSYELVFDAVYTPRNTRLLQEAVEVGAIVVSGVEMFIRQALGQFRLFTGGPAPEEFVRKLVQEQV
ncbi:hypothetical protein FEM48_Zijuj09G0030800 [Ziziphus jujuba var. spinosa]|uniref:Shikimate dehydrogenase n=1 Tax=Ziziphus jujuba var. spinosa TaxID=714518 RepID=A0A978UQJ1_ZIZJJ|nr:hypothetical protein FEM48_Zijuj09G0030800 [Ziziphus jujuba var. spinosa]